MGVVENPKPQPLGTPLLTCQYHISVSLLPCYILELVTCFGDFGDCCGLLLRVTELFGDWGIVNVIVMWDK
jgi:hypothetical protein